MGRPFIHINFAAEETGVEESPQGFSGNVSCHDDWRRVHLLRERYDAIAVGGRTWNLDRPRLSVRAERLGREPRRQPVRVIFAGSQPCLVPPTGTAAFVVGNCRDPGRGATALSMRGHDLRAPLQSLYALGVGSLFVEGGPTLLRSFFSQGFADAVTIFVRAGTAEAAIREARGRLGPLPGAFSARLFGEGFLLEAGSAETGMAAAAS
ncbi:RibD family protein [Telmatospirillum siberiense]|nr:dihydrofolate reductase family protein [Telmatospirillum siberiense]